MTLNRTLMERSEKPPTFSGLVLSRWFRVWLHTVVVTVVACSWVLWGDPQKTLRLGGVIIFPMFLCFSFLEARTSRLHLTPLSFYFAWYSVGLGLSAVHVASRFNYEPGLPLSVRIIEPADAAVGYIVFLVGSLVLHATLQATRPVLSVEATAYTARLGRLVTAFVAGAALLLHPALFSRFGLISGLAQSLPLAVLCLYAILDHDTLRLSSRFYWAGLIIGTVVLLWINVHSTSKAFVLFSFLPLVWALLIRPPLRRFIPVLGFLLIVLLLLVLQPLFATAREVQRVEGGQFLDQLRSASKGSQAQRLTLSQSLDEFLNRQFDPAPAGFLVGEVRRSGHLMGSTLSSLPSAFVPRILWPDKPPVSRGAWFTVYLGFAPSEDLATTSTGMSAPGELYWNFGWAGVVGGMALIGIGLGRVWRQSAVGGSVGQALLYVLLVLTMSNMPDAGTTIVGIVALIVLFRISRLIIMILRGTSTAGGRV